MSTGAATVVAIDTPRIPAAGGAICCFGSGLSGRLDYEEGCSEEQPFPFTDR
jgi:hypothetical protein